MLYKVAPRTKGVQEQLLLPDGSIRGWRLRGFAGAHCCPVCYAFFRKSAPRGGSVKRSE